MPNFEVKTKCKWHYPKIISFNYQSFTNLKSNSKITVIFSFPISSYIRTKDLSGKRKMEQGERNKVKG